MARSSPAQEARRANFRPANLHHTKQKRAPKRLSQAAEREFAIRSLYHDGLVPVNDVILHAHLDRLNEKMIRDAYTLQSRKADTRLNWHRNNLQQDAP